MAADHRGARHERGIHDTGESITASAGGSPADERELRLGMYCQMIRIRLFKVRVNDLCQQFKLREDGGMYSASRSGLTDLTTFRQEAYQHMTLARHVARGISLNGCHLRA